MILFVFAALALLLAAFAFRFAWQAESRESLPSMTAHQARSRLRRGAVIGALTLLCLCCFALAFASHSSSAATKELPGATVVLVDVSGSISDTANVIVGKVLDSFRRFPPDRRAGVVFFSSTANVGAPLSTSPRDIANYGRFFETWTQKPISLGGGNGTQPPPNLGFNYPYQASGFLSGDFSDGRNPWSSAFDGGTEISQGLAVARKALLAAKARGGRVVLLSDLQDDASDIDAVINQLKLLKAEGQSLIIVPLPTTRGDAQKLAGLSYPYKEVFGNGIVVEDPKVAANGGRPIPNGATDVYSRHHLLIFSGALVLTLLLLAAALGLPVLRWEAAA